MPLVPFTALQWLVYATYKKLVLIGWNGFERRNKVEHAPASSSNSSKSFFFDIVFSVVLDLSRCEHKKRDFLFGVGMV